MSCSLDSCISKRLVVNPIVVIGKTTSLPKFHASHQVGDQSVGCVYVYQHGDCFLGSFPAFPARHLCISWNPGLRCPVETHPSHEKGTVPFNVTSLYDSCTTLLAVYNIHKFCVGICKKKPGLPKLSPWLDRRIGMGSEACIGVIECKCDFVMHRSGNPVDIDI